MNANLGIGKITTPYGGRTAYEKVHPGVDVANRKGTVLPSTVSGVVTAVVNGFRNGDKGFGNQVMVKDKGGNLHKFGHLYKSFVRPGQQVQRGQPIMQMGDSGSSYSPSGGDSSHLDYRIVNAYGKYKNPMTYLKSYL